jgi:hypothetical protein
MPSKCSFCRRKYTRSGAYEKHLRTAHAKLDIVLASTVRYTSPPNYITDTETSDLHHPVVSGRADSDYESDPDPAGYGRDEFPDDVVHESDTEELNDTTSSPAGKPMDYPGAGEAIGDVNGFEQEHRDLCEDPWAPFASAHGFKLASWFIQSKVPKSRINEYFSSGLGNSASVGYSSMHTLENHLRSFDPYSLYLQWFEGQVDDGRRTLPFFYRNILDCVRYLLRQIAYRDDFVYAPRREYDCEGQRVYSEMHTADWWWNVQVQRPNLLQKHWLTDYRRHFHMVQRLSQSLGCPIRPISATSLVTRKRGLSILRLEIFWQPGVTDLDQWLSSFLHYCPFRPNSQSPPQQTNSRDKSMPTHYRVYSN